VTRPRAADDFPMIRSRILELRRERNGGATSQPRAADDFATIRARMEELRRERSQVSADEKARLRIGPRPYHRGATGHTEDHRDRLLPRSVVRTSVR
jgi:hypothetical protein